jgi:glycolate oxidase FAD binding subunit
MTAPGLDAIAGVAARRTVTPRDRPELAALVRDAYAAGEAFAVVGGATNVELGNRPARIDTIVRTTALDRVIDYTPEDQTVTVEAGVTFAALDAVLAAHGQQLPIDVVDRERSTVGGALAANAFGARRHRYGSLKDLILGVEIVRPDGTVAHGGGKVVKNVAGFDLPKLMVGSLGTLGAIAAATFRVAPLPAARAGVLVRGVRTPSRALDVLVAALAGAQLEPASLTGRRGLGGDDVLVRYEGTAAAVDAQVARTLDLAAGLAESAALASDEEIADVERHERAVRSRGEWRVCLTVAPARLVAARRGALRDLLDKGIWYPSLGVLFASSNHFELASEDIPAQVDAARAACGGSLVFGAMPARWRERIDAWGAPPPAFALMRALKDAFDPRGLCNPGRFVGGL